MTDQIAEPADDAVAATPEKEAERQIVRAIGRALCRNDGAGGAEMKARWNDGRAKYSADARKLMRMLAKEGVTLTAGEPPARGEPATEDDSET